MYTESSDGKVVITLNRSDYNGLLIALGYGIAAALHSKDQIIAQAFIRLANTINEGNPDWEPYYVPDEETGELREMSLLDIPLASPEN